MMVFLHIEIGLAVVRPAEFIVIRIFPQDAVILS